ncbi:hypothetical protein QJQ45_012597 [Haematococcus lacustris]|nr:hypothetical protein QJQ45_012597 [Haematococcus lacustris]
MQRQLRLRSDNRLRLRVQEACTWRLRGRPSATLAAEQAIQADVLGGETFYDLLGVAPTADLKTVRRAYLGLIKECHPDRSNFEANEFCALLNDIYETLSDPQRRATYDALVGFSEESINPFLDITTERDQVFVDEATCIGCRNCCNVCPGTFAMEEEFGRARVHSQGRDPPELQQEAIDTCPVTCIHWVTPAQLSLLEGTMARMEKTAVWAMAISGKGSAQDVFTEASMAWHKRWQEMQRRRAAAVAQAEEMAAAGAGARAKKQGMGSWWNNIVSFQGAAGSSFQDQLRKQRAKQQQQQQQQQQQGGSTASSGSRYSSGAQGWDGGVGGADVMSEKDAKSIAALAARAARASRTFKVAQQAREHVRLQFCSLATAAAAMVKDAPRALQSTSSGSSSDGGGSSWGSGDGW